MKNSIAVCAVTISDVIGRLEEVFIDSVLTRTKYVSEIVLADKSKPKGFYKEHNLGKIKLKRIGNRGQEKQSSAHAVGLHACLNHVDAEYILISDLDVFFYTAVDEIYLNLMQENDLFIVGVAVNNPSVVAHKFFPVPFNFLVKKEELPNDNFLKDTLQFNLGAQFTERDFKNGKVRMKLQETLRKEFQCLINNGIPQEEALRKTRAKEKLMGQKYFEIMGSKFTDLLKRKLQELIDENVPYEKAFDRVLSEGFDFGEWWVDKEFDVEPGDCYFINGKYLLPGPVEETWQKFSNCESGSYDTACNLFTWCQQTKDRWMSFLTMDNHIYTTGVHRTNVKIKNKIKRSVNLIHHLGQGTFKTIQVLEGTAENPRQIEEFVTLYEKTKVEDTDD